PARATPSHITERQGGGQSGSRPADRAVDSLVTPWTTPERNPMSRLTGKNALVTGGSSGIGLAVARSFLEEGARVAITGRDEAKLRQAAVSLKAGDRLLCHAADVGKAEQVEELVRRVTGHFGRIDLLVNNAGLNIKERALRQLTPETWRRLLEANLDGAFYC